MAVTVEIGDSVRQLQEVEKSWVYQEVDRRRQKGLPVCVEVSITSRDVNMTLFTPGCLGRGGGGVLGREEGKVLELWRQHGLNKPGFTAEDVLAFLSHLDK